MRKFILGFILGITLSSISKVEAKPPNPEVKISNPCFSPSPAPTPSENLNDLL